MIASGQHVREGKLIIMRESETSYVGSERRGSDSVAIHMLENING
jgi:hypothetical protein